MAADGQAPDGQAVARMVAAIRACRLCEPEIEARPVIRASASAKICIAGQAPGIRVHNTGIPFNDPSGERLRAWMGVDSETFYDEARVAIVPMAFCFPGYNEHGSDKPPRRECAVQWREKLFTVLPPFGLTLVVGSYAQAWHLKGRLGANMTETVKAWRTFAPKIIPLPHPSWRNNAWLKKNPWFEDELLPYLRSRVRRVLRG
jgi:uracil-DNA glycosylase